MKKNKLLYILTILITLFTFNMNVKAEDALTCVYKNNSDNQKKVALIKTGLGDYEVYTNDKGESVDGDNWIQQNYKIKINKIVNGIGEEVKEKITVCPDTYTNYEDLDKNITFFYGLNQGMTGKFVESHKGVKILPPIVENSTMGITSNVSCDTMADINGIAIDKLDTSKYNMSCIYAFDFYETIHYQTGGNDKGSLVQGCHIIQIDVNKNGRMYAGQYFPLSTTDGFKMNFEFSNYSNTVNVIEQKYNGWCPSNIYVKADLPTGGVNVDDRDMNSIYQENNTTGGATIGDKAFGITVSLDEQTGYKSYSLNKGVGYNLLTNEKYPDNDYNIHLNKIGIVDCDTLFEGDGGQHIKDILKFVIGLVKIFIPILLIGLGIFDFATAVFSGAEDKMKKAQEKFIKRVIIGVCLFLIPTIITFTLKLYNTVWDKNISTDFCGILD